jgi:hypothetical protein
LIQQLCQSWITGVFCPARQSGNWKSRFTSADVKRPLGRRSCLRGLATLSPPEQNSNGDLLLCGTDTVCVIRKVPFKTPDRKPRIVWADVIAESEGLALVLVPKPERNGSHTIFTPKRTSLNEFFEAVTPYRFGLESEAVKEAGEKLRMLGKSFHEADLEFWFRRERHDDY